MTDVRRQFKLGIKLRPTTSAASSEGELRVDSADNKLKAYLNSSERSVVTEDQSQTITNKTIDADNNTISNLAHGAEVDNPTSGVHGVTGNIVGDSDTQTLTNKTIDVDNNTVTNIETDNFKASALTSDLNASATATQLVTADEVKSYIDTAVAAKDDASEITYTPVDLTDWNGSVDPGNVDGGLDQLADRVKTNEGSISTNASNHTAHLNDTTDAHDASAISYDNTSSGLTATQVQAAIDEVEGRVDTLEAAGGVTSFNSRTGAVVPASGDYDASEVDYTPSTLADWNGSVDPGQTDDALDQLAARTKVNDDHVTATSGEHGITGSFVGTTDTQTLTNKTLTSPDINGGTIDGADINLGTASNTSKIVVSKDTKTNLDGLTREEASIYFASDEKKYYGDDGTTLIDLGGGSGGTLDVFYQEEFEQNTSSDFATGNNASFLGGGTIDGTLADETSSPLAKDRSIKYTMSTASSNDYFAAPTITLEDKAKSNMAEVSFYYTYDGADDDIRLVMYDVTNAKEIVVDNKEIKAVSTSTKHKATFYIPNTSVIRVGFQVTTGNNTKVFLFDDIEIKLDPINSLSAPETYEWNDDGAIILTGTTSNPTKGTTVFDKARWRRVGDSMELIVSYFQTNTSSVGSGDYEIEIPGGYLVDTNKVTTDATVYGASDISGSPTILGHGITGNTTTADKTCSIYASANNKLKVAINGREGVWGSGNLAFDASKVLIKFKAMIPIEGWTVNTAMELESPNNVQSGHYQNFAGTGSTNTAIPYYTNSYRSQGSGVVSITNDSTNGFGITAIVDCELEVSMAMNINAAGTGLGASVDSTQLTTDINSITASDRVTIFNPDDANNGETCSVSLVLQAGETFRPHMGATRTTSVADRWHLTYKAKRKNLAVIVPAIRTCYIKDLKSDGSDGGGFSSGSWVKRDLNTLSGDSSFVSLTSSEFELDPGRYEIEWSAPGHQVDTHQSRLYNVTDAASEEPGSSTQSSSGSGSSSVSFGFANIEISTAKTYRIEHQCQTTNGSTGLGRRSSFSGESEVYTQVKITKVL